MEGTVIFAGWTVETGYVIYIQHDNNLVSVYKHNSELLKKMGDHANAGEIIAFMGNTGELTTGPHLHFELWHKGTPLDPEKYIDF
jgi:murein DD-endopeptidase MepM/ murein hydrolase activator NlpD